jgi:glycosyltransferase involved in cell wall biosynthesis
MKKKVLILPSWYPNIDSPTSGSFFHEQSLLLETDGLGFVPWDVQVLTTEKEWISLQRNWLYKLFPKKIPNRYSPQFLRPPKGVVIAYPFCKFSSDEDNLRQEINAILRYFEMFPNQKPDLIHAHCALKGGVIACYLAKKWNIPYIVTEHFSPFNLHNYSVFWKKEIVLCLEEANAVLAVSEHQRQHILMHEINCNPIVTGNLVDDQRFVLQEKVEHSPLTHFLIVTFYPNFIKDMDTFFAALEGLKLSNQLTNKYFTIVGGGELSGALEENYYEKKIKQLQIEDTVTVVPIANRSEIVRLMQETDVLISTSIAESFGVAICEALLSGKPVISTLNGGVNDFLTDQNSIRIPIKNPDALQNAILQMVSELNTFQPNSLRAGIVENYGRKVFRKRMDEIYFKTLAQ